MPARGADPAPGAGHGAGALLADDAAVGDRDAPPGRPRARQGRLRRRHRSEALRDAQGRGAHERRRARADARRLAGYGRARSRLVREQARRVAKPALDELGELWYRSFGYWSTEDLEAGLLFKYVDNAEAMARVSIAQTPQEWARVMLEKQFDNLLYDNGPHSFTRVVLRHRLWHMAKGNDEAKRAGAIRTLKFMKERGVLLALRNASRTRSGSRAQRLLRAPEPEGRDRRRDAGRRKK